MPLNTILSMDDILCPQIIQQPSPGSETAGFALAAAVHWIHVVKSIGLHHLATSLYRKAAQVDRAARIVLEAPRVNTDRPLRIQIRSDSRSAPGPRGL